MVDIRSIPQTSVRTEWTQVSLDNCDSISSDFVALDIETTGLDPQHDAIIEVAAIRFVDGVAVSSYEALINAGVPVSAGAYNVNHISDFMLAEYGKDPDVVYSKLGEFLNDVLNGTTVLCAHFAGFDLSFLTPALGSSFYEGCIRYVDTWALAKDTIESRDIPNYKLQTLARHLHMPEEPCHRALADAMVCGKVLLQLLSMRRGQLEAERHTYHIFTDAELETYAVIIHTLRNNGCNTQDIAITKNSSGLIDVWDYCENKVLLRFKHAKKTRYLVVKNEYEDGCLRSEDCPYSEGEDNVRLFLTDPFDLEECGNMFEEIYSNLHVDYLATKRDDAECLCMYEIQRDLERHYIHALLRWNHEGHWIYEKRPSYRASFLGTHGIYFDAGFGIEDDDLEEDDSDPHVSATTNDSFESDGETSLSPEVEPVLEQECVRHEEVSTPVEPALDATATIIDDGEPEFDEEFDSTLQPLLSNGDDREEAYDTEAVEEQSLYSDSADLADSAMDCVDDYSASAAATRPSYNLFSGRLSFLNDVIGRIPGFRSGNMVHAVVAIIGYLLILWMVFSAEWTDRSQPHGVALLWAYRLCILGYAASMVDICTGNNSLAPRLPILHSKNVFLRILGYVAALLVLPFFWAVILVIVSAIIASL